jgi:hypothetical protein
MSNTQITTTLVRFSYANVFEAKENLNGDMKFGSSLIIPKSDKAGLKKINAAIKAAIEEGKSLWGGKIPKGLKLPLRDGDIDRDEKPEYAGAMFLNANSGRRPQVVDANRNEILDEDAFYSGCYGRASLNFYPFNAGGSKGIAVGLNAVQKLKDGEPLSAAHVDVDQAFGDLDGIDLDDDELSIEDLVG